MLGRMLLSGALMTTVGLEMAQPLASSVTARGLQTYVNTRFRFRVSWPGDVLTAHGEPDNADGQSFTAPGATFRVYGSYMVEHDDLREVYAAEIAARGATVQYRRLTPTFFVLSGMTDGKVYYRKIVAASDDRLLVLDAEYDEARRGTYDPIVRDMARSLSPL